jgi:hypothetical protein
MPRTRTNACDGKKKHRDRAAADRHRQRLIRNGSSPALMRVYPCKWCDSYHVGHRRQGRR